MVPEGITYLMPNGRSINNTTSRGVGLISLKHFFTITQFLDGRESLYELREDRKQNAVVYKASCTSLLSSSF